MAFKPYTLFADRQGRRIRVYAEPRNVVLGHRLRRIEDILSVTQDLSDAVIVRLGKESITFVPKEATDRFAIRDCLVRYNIGKRHFGPIIRPVDLLRKCLTWKVICSSGIRRVVDGWEFTNVDGLKIGLSFARWRQQYKDRILITDNSVSLDLDGIEGDQNGELNLDPETVAVASFLRLYGTTIPADPGWDTWRTAASAPTGGSINVLKVEAYNDGFNYDMSRSALRFNTLAIDPLGKATKAELYLYWDSASSVVHSNYCHISVGDFGTTIEVTDWNDIKTAYETNPIAALPDIGGASGWASLDVISKYESTTTFDIALASIRDVDNNEGNGTWPDIVENYIEFLFSGDYTTYLELTLPPGPPTNTLMLLNAGR